MSGRTGHAYGSGWKIAVLVFVLVLCGGCQHTIEMTEGSDSSESFVPLAEEPDGGMPLAYVKTVKVLSDGIESEPADGVFYRFRTKLLETKLFYDVVFQRPPLSHVEFNLTISETSEMNHGANFAKGLAAAMTLFLLAPVLPQNFEYRSEYTMHVTNLSGNKNVYTARSGGELVDPMGRMHLSELQKKVIYKNLNSLMSQLVADAEFILKDRGESNLAM